MRGCVDWTSTGYRSGISADIDPAVRDPSDPEHNKICFLQRYQTGYG